MERVLDVRLPVCSRKPVAQHGLAAALVPPLRVVAVCNVSRDHPVSHGRSCPRLLLLPSAHCSTTAVAVAQVVVWPVADTDCWERGDTTGRLYFQVPLWVFMALSVLSLAYAVCRLRTGTAATLHLRRDRLWRHSAYVAAFVGVWVWPVAHAVMDFDNGTAVFTYLDAVAVSGQAFLFACIRLSEPGAWAVIRGIAEPLLLSYGRPGGWQQQSEGRERGREGGKGRRGGCRAAVTVGISGHAHGGSPPPPPRRGFGAVGAGLLVALAQLPGLLWLLLRLLLLHRPQRCCCGRRRERVGGRRRGGR